MREQPLRYGFGLVRVGPLTPLEAVREGEQRQSALRERVRQADEQAQAAQVEASFWRGCWSEIVDHLLGHGSRR